MSPQASIAHYRMTGKLGEGGMGEVWRARDTKLNREVAIKILPEAFASNPDRLARFTREAQVLASLNHQNIAAIYGVEDNAIVMELVEGPTLAERIAQGPMTMDEALPLVRQIVDALEYAHDKGIVHRDLKPANIKVTPQGRVKVLDFGLAKAMEPNQSAPPNPASSPTLTMRDTELGVILGTAGYLAPEQARGQAVDQRADIWAFGVVLWEMVTGRTLFAGQTMADTLAAVLKTEPDWGQAPVQWRRLLRNCLVKDPQQRLRYIGDALRLMDDEQPAATSPSARRSIMPWTVAVVSIIVAVVAVGSLWYATRPVDRPLTRLNVDLGPDALPGLNLTAAISPDGRRLVFLARGPDGKQRLATRLLDQPQPTLLPGTEEGSSPFFSPDGQWIGFFSGGHIKKVSVQGGAPVTLGGAINRITGAAWAENGDIVASTGITSPLSRFPTNGGTPRPLTKLAPDEIGHRSPQVLPGGNVVIFTSTSSATSFDNARIEAVSLQTGQVKILHEGGYFGRYLPSGHLLYVHQGVLFGVKFDPKRLEVHGEPVPLLENIPASPAIGGSQFDFSSAGTLLYAAGAGTLTWNVEWLNSSGKMQPLIAAPGSYVYPRISPDARKLAFTNGPDLYIHDLERNTTSRLSSTGHAGASVWAPDGKHLVFQSAASGLRFYWIRSDGSGDPVLLFESPNYMVPSSFSPDGRRLSYHRRNPNTGLDIWTLPLDLSNPDHPKPGKPELFLSTPADELVLAFSPDGRWISYRSNESGDFEIYVRPFPAASGGKWQISNGGGLYGLWSKNGRELFYETTDNRIMVVDYTVDGASFVPGKPRLWSDKQLFYLGNSNLDLAPDGKRFAVLALPDAEPGKGSVHVTMLFNFFDELKRRIP
jgi:serine/threonine-protein kinase